MTTTRLAAALEVQAAARAVGSGGQRAGVVVSTLRRMTGCEAVALSRWDNTDGLHRALSDVGFSEAALRFLNENLHLDELFVRPLDNGQPVRWCALPSGRRGRVLRSVMAREGYRNGLSLRLFDTRGRGVGVLHLASRDPMRPDRDDAALLALLGCDLARVLSGEGLRDLRAPRLSPRERQVLRLVATGMRNSEIADELQVAPRTVGTHVEHLLAKLDVPNRAAAAAWAARHGMLDGLDSDRRLRTVVGITAS